MAIQAVTSFIYQAVEQSWLVATVLVKYIILVHAAELLYQKDFSLRKLEDVVLKYSYAVVTAVVFLGLVTALVGASIQPNFKLLSQLVALTYFGFLFWKF